MQVEIADRRLRARRRKSHLIDPKTSVEEARAMGFGVGGLGMLGLGSGAKRPFDPTLISGCVAWLRADKGVTLNSGNVSAWADQSGAGIIASVVQGTAANQPLFVASAINGKPALRGRDSNGPTAAWLASAASFSNPANFTAFAIFSIESSSPPTNDYLIGFNYTGGATYSSLFMHDASPQKASILDDSAAAQTADVGTPVANPGANIAYAIKSSSGAAMRCSLNRSSETTHSGTLALNRLAVMVRGDGAWNFTGDLAEVVVYNRVLTPTEITQFEDYATARYASP